MDGLILIDKPRYSTSHDIVAEIRRILNFKKIGHFGTLDPLATGLLLIAVGKATKLFSLFSKEDKGYRGRIRLGLATDTFDAAGEPAGPECRELPDEPTLLEAMKNYEGEITQLPPPFSAKKFQGRPLYKFAREKKPMDLRPSRITIRRFELNRYAPPDLDFEVTCTSGTYIRSLAHDLGRDLGCGAHLTELTRTSIGPYTLDASLSLEEVGKLAAQGRIPEFLIPLEALFPQFPKVILKEPTARTLQKGGLVPAEGIQKILNPDTLPPSRPEGRDVVFSLFSMEGMFLALARWSSPESSKSGLVPFLILNSLRHQSL